MSSGRWGWGSTLASRALTASLLTLACGEDELPPADAVYVRIQNGTAYDFDDVSMIIPGTNMARSFGPIGAGDASAYQAVERIYSIAGGFATAGDLDFCGTVIDNVGDELLGIGYHTYDISVQLGTGCLPEFDGWASFQGR